MATIQNENKENRLPELQKQGTNAMAAQQKRPALSQRNNVNVNVQVHRGKQPLGVNTTSNLNKLNIENIYKDPESNECVKEKKNLVNPIVPVAQFEAFKVYEDKIYDEERMARIDEKLKSRIRPTGLIQVYKGTAEDRFYTKKEVAELERKKREEDAARGVFHPFKDLVKTPDPSPMSVEKSFDEEVSPEDVLLWGSKNTKDIFFEMEEYRADIYNYLREHELRHRPKPGYMKKQPDVTSNMRTILVDWLVEVAEEYKLHTETLYLAINYIDRFLSYMSVVRGKLQLVGTAAMFLASKYEEIFPPEIGEFVYITDDTYKKTQVIRMEHLILKVLGFDLSIPTPLTFITAMCVSSKLSEKIMYLAMYLSELALLNGDVYLEFLPSTIAASSIAIARHTLGYEAWNSTLIETTGYTLNQLQPVIEFLNHMFEIAPTFPQHAIQDKYSKKKYMHVSQLTPSENPIFS